jgi:hypothetical protein
MNKLQSPSLSQRSINDIKSSKNVSNLVQNLTNSEYFNKPSQKTAKLILQNFKSKDPQMPSPQASNLLKSKYSLNKRTSSVGNVTIKYA